VNQDATGRNPARAHYDIVYSTGLPSPHTKWADPYVNGPTRAFFVSSVHEGRAVAELMQRLTLEPRAVSIDPRWDVNKWCIDRYAEFDSLVPKDYSKSYAVLAEELAAEASYDVLVMHSMLGWNTLPAEVKESVLARVKRGEGLVLVHPHLGEDRSDEGLWDLSPLVNVESTTLDAPGAGIEEGYPKPPRHAMSGNPWKQAAEHYIPSGIPFAALPYPALKHFRYQLAKDAQALVTGVDGVPVVAVKQYGRGRVVGLGYHSYALFPELSGKRGELNENFWEYLFGLLMRSIIWAARKEPKITVASVAPSSRRFALEKAETGAVAVHLRNRGGPAPAKVTVTFRDEFRDPEGETTVAVRLRQGGNLVEVPLPSGLPACGRHFADVIVSAGGKKADWGTGLYEVKRPAQVTTVKLDAEAVPAGGSFSGAAQLRGDASGLTLRIELWDLLGRLLDARSVAVGRRKLVEFRLRCPEALTHAGWVKCRLLDGQRYVHEAQVGIVLTAPRRKWEDYEVIIPWLHDGLWPWTDLIESQYRRAGMTSSSDPRYNFPLTVSMHPPGFGVYWYRRHRYVRQRERYGQTKDKQYLARVPCFHRDEFRQPVARVLRKGIPPILKYSPLAYYVADESSVTCYSDAFDLCWEAATLVAFRAWLRKIYRRLDALNAEWGTRYRSWEKIMPVTWEEAQARGNPAPWVDHRLFMNKTLVTGFKYARDVAKRADPEGMVTISGTQLPGSHNGCDWWQMDQIVQYLQPYSVGGQDEMHRSFNPGMILTGFTGYTQSGPPLEHEIWHRLLHGHRGASIFWGYSFVDPDLTLNAQGRSFEKTFGELRGEGISRTVNRLTRAHDKIAIHFSMASGHVWWVSDGKLVYKELEDSMSTSPNFARFIRSREGWGCLLEDLGYQYDYLSYEQIEDGDLAKGGYRVLILPGSVALSQREVDHLRTFVKRGGAVIADVMPGTTTVHGRPLPESSLQEVFAAAKYGRGQAVVTQRWLHEYHLGRTAPVGEEARATVRRVLEANRVTPRVQVTTADGGPPLTIERVSWVGGGLQVVGLLKEMRGLYTESSDGTMRYVDRPEISAVDRVRVAAPKAGHWYDLRAHKYLGEKRGLTATLREADPKLYAILPYQVKALRLAVEGGRKPGEVVGYTVKLTTGPAKPARHVAKIEVFSPDGAKHALYSGSIDTRGGKGSGRFRLALNDTVGTWRLVATDVISGVKAEASWRVRR